MQRSRLVLRNSPRRGAQTLHRRSPLPVTVEAGEAQEIKVGVQSRANKERLVGGPQPRAACDPRRQKEKSTRFRWEITCICCVVHPPTRRLPGTCSPTPSPPPCLNISRGMKNSTSVRISLPFGASCESGPLYVTHQGILTRPNRARRARCRAAIAFLSGRWPLAGFVIVQMPPSLVLVGNPGGWLSQLQCVAASFICLCKGDRGAR